MAKQTKKLTRRQKEVLTKKHVDCMKYRLVSEDLDSFTVVNEKGEMKTFHF